MHKLKTILVFTVLIIPVFIFSAYASETSKEKCNKCLIRCTLLYNKKFSECLGKKQTRQNCVDDCSDQRPESLRISIRFQATKVCNTDYNDCISVDPPLPNQEKTCTSKKEDCMRKVTENVNN